MSDGQPTFGGAETAAGAPQSAFNNRPGRRVMKEYPLTGPELIGLGGMSLAATLSFGVASWCGTNWFEIYKDLALASGVAPQTVGYWQGLRQAFGAGAIVSAGVGLVFVALNGLSIWQIMRNTSHN